MSRIEVRRGSRTACAREGGREEAGEGASYLVNAGNHIGADSGHVAVAIHLPQEAVEVHDSAHRGGCVLCWCGRAGRREDDDDGKEEGAFGGVGLGFSLAQAMPSSHHRHNNEGLIQTKCDLEGGRGLCEEF